MNKDNNYISEFEDIFFKLLDCNESNDYDEDGYDNLYNRLYSVSYRYFDITNAMFGLNIIKNNNIYFPDHKLKDISLLKQQMLIYIAKHYGWSVIELPEVINDALEAITNINSYLSDSMHRYNLSKIEIDGIHNIMNGASSKDVFISIFKYFNMNINDFNLINVLSKHYMEVGCITAGIIFKKPGSTKIKTDDLQQLTFFNMLYDIPTFVIKNDIGQSTYIGILGFDLFDDYYSISTLDFINCAAFSVFFKDLL